MLKKWISTLLVLILLLFSITAGYAQRGQEDVFSYDEVAQIFSMELNTVGVCADLLKPTSYSWIYQGEATGMTELTIENEDGSLTVLIIGKVNEEDQGSAASIPEDVMALNAYPQSASWKTDAFCLEPIRGVTVGMAKEDVIRRFPSEGNTESGILYQIAVEDENPAHQNLFVGGRVDTSTEAGYDELITYTAVQYTDEGGWWEYYTLAYQIFEGKVQKIVLKYGSDAE